MGRDRFDSSHLDRKRRELFRSARKDAFNASGSETSIKADSPSAPVIGVLFVPSCPIAPAFMSVDPPEPHHERHDLKVGYTVLGRSKSSDIVVPPDYQYVSRRHCLILAHGSGFAELFDLGSMNGTFLNDVRVSGYTTLRSGDVIRLGDNCIVTVFLYKDDPDTVIRQKEPLPVTRS